MRCGRNVVSIGEGHPAKPILDERVEELREKFHTYVAQTSDHSLDFPIGGSETVYLRDQYGKQYLDFTSGIGVMNLGHGRADVIGEMLEVLRLYTHTMVYGEHIHPKTVMYAEELSKRFPNKNGHPQQVFFVNSGNEAVDLALKMARKIRNSKVMGALKGGFHGRGYGAMSVSWREEYKKGFFVDDSTFFIDPEAKPVIEPRTWLDTAGLIMELVQGESGSTPLDPVWAKELVEGAQDRGALVIFDEIQTGFGRTGSFLAQEQYGLVPDITILGKAGGGGLPFGAVVSSRSNFERLQDPPLSHLSTFGGNPVVTAAGWAVLQHMNQPLFENVKRCGTILANGVIDLSQQFPDVIAGVRGLGLMQGLILRSPEFTEPFYFKCRERGLLLHFKLNSSNILRMSPPLVITDSSIKEALNIMADAAMDLMELIG
jgi:acetylornithine/N-succinyldiaminopimelate aminotransferase